MDEKRRLMRLLTNVLIPTRRLTTKVRRSSPDEEGKESSKEVYSELKFFIIQFY